MTTFRVGERVVCVDASIQHAGACPRKSGWDYEGGLEGLKEREIYTIRHVGRDPELCAETVRLAEIIRGQDYALGEEATYLSSRFRPLVTRTAEQDAELFLPLLSHDPLDIATLYERDFADTEARLERLWTAMRSFEL